MKRVLVTFLLFFAAYLSAATCYHYPYNTGDYSSDVYVLNPAKKCEPRCGRCTVFQPCCRPHYNPCCHQYSPGYYNNCIDRGAGVGNTTGNGKYYTNYNTYNVFKLD